MFSFVCSWVLFLFLVWFLVVGLLFAIHSRKFGTKFPKILKQSRVTRITRMVYGKLVPTKHTDDAKEEEPTPGILGLWLFRGQKHSSADTAICTEAGTAQRTVPCHPFCYFQRNASCPGGLGSGLAAGAGFVTCAHGRPAPRPHRYQRDHSPPAENQNHADPFPLLDPPCRLPGYSMPANG